MKVLRLKLYQESACYKKPFAYKVTETYPLPPYSTVTGMLHNIIHATEYVPMKLSIQGNYESIFNSYNTMYFYKSNEVTTMPLNTHMLFGVNITIHVKAEIEILEKILSCIKEADEHFSLGRREDLVRIDKAEFVELKNIDAGDFEENIVIKKPVYIPKDKLPCKLNGINYRLNCKYEIINDIRQWEKVDVLYVDNGQEIDEGLILMDDYNDMVFFS